jgi:cytidylate kinase
MNNIINIGRQVGSGGLKIGKMISTSLGFEFYDKELLMIASKESGLCKEFFEKADESPSGNLFGSIINFSTPHRYSEGLPANILSNETLFKIQSDIIKELANRKPSVFVGRCADYILRDNAGCINIFICADIEDRIRRLCEDKTVREADKAAGMLEKMDRKRAGYYNFFTNKVWGSASSYHLCINSSVLGIDGTTEYLLEFIRKRL